MHEGDTKHDPVPAGGEATPPAGDPILAAGDPVITASGQRPPAWRGVLVLVAVLAMAGALWLATDRQAVMEWKDEAGPAPFFAAMALLPALGFPMTPFFVAAGALYGPLIGLCGTAIAICVNLLVCYAISHSALRPRVVALIRRIGYEPPDFSSARGHAWRFALVVRFAPAVPTFIKNYLLALAGVPLGIYLLVSFIFNFAYAAAFILLGDSLLDRDWSDVVLIVGVLCVGGGAVWLVRKVRKKKAGASVSDPQDPA